MVKVNEAIEQLEEIGQESEKKGVKAVQDIQREIEKNEEKKFFDTANKLDFNKDKTHQEYRRRILEEAQFHLSFQTVPKGYFFQFGLTSKGLVLWIRDPQHKWHANGMTISQSPLFDAQGIIRLLDKGLVYVDILEERRTNGRNVRKQKSIS